MNEIPPVTLYCIDSVIGYYEKVMLEQDVFDVILNGMTFFQNLINTMSKKHGCYGFFT